MRAARPTGAVVLLACTLLALPAALTACGADEDAARYVASAVDSSWGVSAAGVDGNGLVVLSGEDRALTVPAGEENGVVDGKAFGAPAELASDDPRGVSVDLDRHAWVLVGDALVPVAAGDGKVHPVSTSLAALSAPDPGEVVPGAEPTQARTATAVAVESDQDIVVGSRTSLGHTGERVNVTVHRLKGDGPGELLAGRAWTDSEDRPKPATDIPAGEAATATNVDLDEVAAIQPIDAARLWIITSKPTDDSLGALSFFLLEGTRLRHLDVGSFYARKGTPAVTTSLLTNGRVVVNLSTNSGDSPAPATLAIDPSGTAKVIEDGSATQAGYGQLMVADADGGKLVVVTPPGLDPEDDDNKVNVRITSTPAPSGG